MATISVTDHCRILSYVDIIRSSLKKIFLKVLYWFIWIEYSMDSKNVTAENMINILIYAFISLLMWKFSLFILPLMYSRIYIQNCKKYKFIHQRDVWECEKRKKNRKRSLRTYRWAANKWSLELFNTFCRPLICCWTQLISPTQFCHNSS